MARRTAEVSWTDYQQDGRIYKAAYLGGELVRHDHYGFWVATNFGKRRPVHPAELEQLRRSTGQLSADEILPEQADLFTVKALERHTMRSHISDVIAAAVESLNGDSPAHQIPPLTCPQDAATLAANGPR